MTLPWPEATGRILLDTTDSTNAEAARRAQAGQDCPFWVMSAHQTAARGRRGRGWAMPPGNFAATLALRPPDGAAQWALRSFAAAVAVFDALVHLAPGRAFALKWPNDVLLNGGKLAGILLEAGDCPPGNPLLRIGIGVNLAHAPPPSALEATALRAAALRAPDVTPRTLLDTLAPRYAVWEARLAHDGFAPVRDAWLARAAGIGTQIVARTPQISLTGRFDGIDDTGALLLFENGETRTLPAADVFFAQPEEAIDAAGR